MRRDAVDLAEVAREAAAIAVSPARGRAATVAVTGRAVSAGDRERLLHVFVNLIDNALRHACRRVEVKLAHRRGRATASVIDDGPGLPSDVRHDFGAAHAVGSRGRIGLGAALSRLIVEAHGGALRAANGRGGGARITISMPAADGKQR